jgi:leader peptidase (prepilin peptidase)/N-methyltransferase
MTSISTQFSKALHVRPEWAQLARCGASAALAVVGILATGATWAVLPLIYLAVVTPELARIDLREHRLPNRLVLPGIAVGLVTWGVESIAAWHLVLTPIVAGAASAMFLLALCIVGGIGMGDVKLATALGLAAWVPFVGVLSPVIGFLLGGVGSVILILRGARGRRIAFGPFLLAGFWVAVTALAWARTF